MTQLVGILNITPDSFSDGGHFFAPAAAIKQAKKLFNDGAALVDVGAESTRPGATAVSPQEEWDRLKTVLPELVRLFPGKISLDTRHPETAEKALQLGDVIINDVTGMNNPGMVDVVARHKARCIVSHLPGADIQLAHSQKPVDSQQAIIDDLTKKVARLTNKGVPASNIIVDPGIGFGKTPELNQKLLRFAAAMPGYKVMVGYSRKRFLGEHRMDLQPNLAAGKIAIASGAAYIRVHDVAGHAHLV